MNIHAVMCSYLGDGEVDIGKTARWAQYFTDSLFFYDSYAGTDPRKYAVNYAKTFPDCKFAYHSGASYFVDPAGFRQKAFAASLAAWRYADADWVMFIDCSDGLTVDTPYETLELVSGGTVFKYLYDEVDAATGPALAFPVYIYLNQGTPAAETVIIDPNIDMTTAPPEVVLANQATYWTCNPHYLDSPMADSPKQVVRLVQVSEAKTWTATNWSKVDTYNGYTPLVAHLGLVSYAYARYSEVDYHDPSLWVEANDVGFLNRKAVEAMPERHVGLPTLYASADPAGTPITIPAAPANPVSRVLTPPYAFYVDQFTNGAVTDTRTFGALVRKNPRDGVWYEPLIIGGVPVDPVTGQPDVGLYPDGSTIPPVYWDIQQPNPRNNV